MHSATGESLHLLATAGPDIGRIWTLAAGTATVGRSTDCAIRIDDPAVSRVHCTLVYDGEITRIVDVKQEKAVRVNGASIADGVVRVGDRISLGDTDLILTSFNLAAEGNVDRTLGNTTLHVDESSFAPESLEECSRSGRIIDTADIVAIYALLRRVGASNTFQEAIAQVTRLIEARFRPLQYWIVQNMDEDILLPVITGGERSDIALPETLMREAAEQSDGILRREVVRQEGAAEVGVTIAVPLIFAGRTLGLIAVYTQTPVGMYNDRDLEFLIGMAESVAPVIQALRHVAQLESKVSHLEESAGATTFVGEHESARRVRASAVQAAKSNVNVLVLGETGTGKELVARMIHDYSDRAEEPYVILNCATIPDHLFESEFFGYEKGAFTGADTPRAGFAERADGGTLFLDEVGDLSLPNQAGILRVLEQGSFHRLGGREEIRVDVRFVGATNKDIEAMIREGLFRADLYHRLNILEIHLPALRERASDVPLLARHLLAAMPDGKDVVIPTEVEDFLKAQSWTGNVRQLKNALSRALIRANGGELRASHFVETERPTPPLAGEVPKADLVSMNEVERRHISNVLDAKHWNILAAANILQMSRSTLYKKISEYNLRRPD